ncbi:MAG: Na+-dependent transporter [Alphaproteobacteria bacterium]
MHAQDVILLAVKASIVLTVFAIGLSAQPRDMAYLLKRPAELMQSVLAMSVVMPAIVILLARVFALDSAVKIALFALAVSPVPPFLPTKQLKAGGSRPYVIGLLSATALLSIVTVPLTVALIGDLAGYTLHMPVGAITGIILLTVLAPLALGAGINFLKPELALRCARPLMLGATALLVLGCLPIFLKALPVVAAMIGNGVLLATIAFSVIGLAAGHLLGGPDPDDRTALALATASRHPAIAVAVAQATFPEHTDALMVVLVALVVGAVVSMPYLAWRKKRRTA